MTETQAVSIEDVRLLVAERQRYDDWMAALEAKRAETPTRVFERVYGDYAERRTGVMERLREHVDTLASLGRDLESRLGALESRLASLEDERIEAMLRTAVGEFDDSRWEEIRQEVEASIGEHTTEREALLVEVDEVRTLLASASSEPSRSVLDEPETSQATDTPSSESSDESLLDLAAPDEVAPTEALETTTIVDDVASVEPVVAESQPSHDSNDAHDSLEIDDALVVFSGETESSTPALETVQNSAFTAPAPAAPPVAAPEAVDSFDDLAFLRSVIDPPSGGSMSSNASAPLNGLGDAGVRVEAGTPQKTLRCTECGTMNLPTEWYCERCGGELAAF